MSSAVVIGAGLSGLACARELRRHGVDVTVLEARSSVGGRVVTDRSLSAPVELGAAWIHGSGGNPLTELASGFELATRSFDHDRRCLFDETGRKQPSPLDAFWRELHISRKSLMTDCSVAQSLLASNMDEASLEWCKSFLAMVMGAGAADLSALHWDLEEELEPPDLEFVDGFAFVAEKLARDLDVRLGANVQAICGATGGVAVACGSEMVEGAACAVTVPLGVLKAGKILFEPSLSPERTDAMGRLGVGVLGKLALRFADAFWPEEILHFGMMDPRAPCPGWVAHTGAPILVGYAGGAQGALLERMEESDLLHLAVASLERAFGACPEPVAVARSQWSLDPFFLGAYSHVPVGATGAEYDVLAQPLGQLPGEQSYPVFFAGEHTHRQFPSTTHGAYLSGLRAAKEIMSALGVGPT